MLKKALEVARVVFVNHLKSLWRAYDLKKPRRSPSLLLLVVQYAIALLLAINFVLVAHGRLSSLREYWLGIRPPKNELINLAGDVLSALFTSYLLTHYFKQRKLVVITPDHEFLLYQPLQPKELYAGLVIGLYTYFTVTFLPWLFIVILFTAPWLGFTIFYFFVYIMFADPILFIVSSIVRKLGHSNTALSLAVAYIAIGVAHSAIATALDSWPRVSPLLTYLVKGPYLLAIALCESIGYIAILVCLVFTISAAVLVIYIGGGRLDVSDFTTLGEAYEVRLRQALAKSLKRDVLVDWSSTSDAVRKVVLEFTVYNPRAVLRRYMPLFISLVIAGYALRCVLAIYEPSLLRTRIFDYVAILAYSMIPGVLGTFVGELLSNELKYLWVTRVYLLDLNHFVKPLLAKYVIVYFVILSSITGFLASYRLNPLIALAPLVSSPAIVLSVFITIRLSLVLTKRAKHREPSTSVYRLGIVPALDPVAQLLLALVMTSGLITSVVTATIVELISLGALTYWVVLIVATASVWISYSLIKLLCKPLAMFLAKTDLYL